MGVDVKMFEPISIDHMTSEMLNLTENSVLAEVSRKLLTLENQEDMYHCDYLADSVLKLHDSFNAIMPVIKRTGAIGIIDLYILNYAIKDLHSTLQSVIPQDEIYTVSEGSLYYGTLEKNLIDMFVVCKTIVVSDWDDNNPGNCEMIDAAMRCVSSLLDCVNLILDKYIARQFFAQDIRSYYSRRRAELKRLLDEFREHVE